MGSLMYAMVCKRPNITHVIGTTTQFMSNPTREHCNVVKWILMYICDTSDLRLCFGDDKHTLMGYSDSCIDGNIDFGKFN